jgi:four helix bundle protein
MKENILVDITKKFAIDIINICKVIKEERGEKILVGQLLRSATSIGANLHEGNYASSKADFINKLQIALKECYETDYWLELFKETGYITAEEYKRMHESCSKIRTILTASIKTAKKNV